MYLMKTAGWAGLMKQMLSDAYFVPSVWLECTLKLVSVCLRVFVYGYMVHICLSVFIYV